MSLVSSIANGRNPTAADRGKAEFASLAGGDGGFGLLLTLAVARIAGFFDAAALALTEEPERSVELGWFGAQPAYRVLGFWQAIESGAAGDILNAGYAMAARSGSLDHLGLSFDGLAAPLCILGRGDVLAAMNRILGGDRERWRGASVVESGAVALAQAGDWDNALRILEDAHRDGASPYIYQVTETSLWQHAYRQRRVDDVLPRLAAIPINPQNEHAAEARQWWLKTCRLRAGETEILVPVVGQPEQGHAYAEATATQIAVLEQTGQDAVAAKAPCETLAPQSTSIEFVDRGVGFTFNFSSYALLLARARVAAHRRDMPLLFELARSPSDNRLVVPSDVIIEALIEEGDWTGAAAITERHDPRDRPLIEGLDDDRLRQAAILQEVLAGIAALGGDDDAASRHFANHAELSARDAEERREEPVPPEHFRFGQIVLECVAAGRIRRDLVPVLMSTFRDSW